MKRILILDTETTGLDPKTDAVIEVAAVLYSVEHATVLESFSALMTAPENPAEHVNRIPGSALADAKDPGTAWRCVESLALRAEAFIAHNAEFDHGFTPEPVRSQLPWICSKSDLSWPKQTRPDPSLVALALEHDLGVAYAHRALADCDLIARLLTRSRELGADLEALLARGLRPKAEFIALVPFERKDEAKAAGFWWDGGRRVWHRRMAIEDAAALPFPTRQVVQRSTGEV